MRIIDADEFLENNKELADCDFIHPKYCDTLRDLVNNAPTVDVLEQIKDEIEGNMESIIGKYNSSIPKFNMPSYKIERNKAREECISIIDKYRE